MQLLYCTIIDSATFCLCTFSNDHHLQIQLLIKCLSNIGEEHYNSGILLVRNLSVHLHHLNIIKS